MEQLHKYKQVHLINQLNQLKQEKKDHLRAQIDQVDFDLLTKLHKNRNNHHDAIEAITPIQGSSLDKTNHAIAYKRGLESLKRSEVALVLMAGGQGTRLGHQGPKGTYDIGLETHKSLFEIHCDCLHDLYKETGRYIVWYIMTSEDNHADSVAFFKDNHYFSYPQDKIIFFKQDRLPLMLEKGEIALADDSNLNLAANGNGGVFMSLKTNGLIESMKNDGVKYLFLCGVDNALAKLADPAFVGFMIESNYDVASKAVDKIDASEKVGVMCYKNNKPGIVEYSELRDDLKEETDATGQLVYRHANILAHLFKLDFISKCSELDLPYHVAHKKVDYFDGQNMVYADQPNGYKFELFMFDVFEHADNMAVMTVKRHEEFAPVKNKLGKDSPESARKLYEKMKTNKEVT